MQDINSLLNIALEIEGLVRVLMIRDDAQVRALLRQKAQLLADELAPEATPTPCPQQSSAPRGCEPSEALDETDAKDDEDMAPIDLDSAFSVDILEFDEASPSSAAETEKKEEEHVAEEPMEQQAPAPEAQPVHEAQPASAPEVNPEPRPAKSFITFNEKYRFVRELFNNQHALMSDVVAKVTSMDSLSEAHDYVLNELNLDEDNPVVIEFLEVIARYFNSRS